MFKRKDRPKREFRPQSHAAIYLIALIYLGYLLVQMIGDAREGGPDAPTALHLVAGILVLGGGMVLLAILAWRMYRLQASQSQEDAAEDGPEVLPEADGEDDEYDDGEYDEDDEYDEDEYDEDGEDRENGPGGEG